MTLSPGNAPFGATGLEQVCNAFCAAYAEDEVLHLRLHCSLLRKLLQEEATEDAAGLHKLIDTMIKEAVLVSDFGEGTNQGANECLFR